MKTQILLSFLVLGLSSCNLNTTSPMALENKNQDLSNEEELSPNLSADQITFNLVNEKILSKNCTACHSEKAGNKGDINLETYENVFNHKAAIRSVVFDRSMPPARRVDLKLTETQIKILLDWIDFGALEDPSLAPPPSEQPPVTPAPPIVTPEPPPVVDNPPPVTEPSPGPLPEPVPNKIYFAEVMEKVISTNCLKCHSEKGDNRGDVNLETYQNVFDLRFDIKFDVESNFMPPKPPRGTPLTDEQKKLILDWIDQGALEKAP